MTVFSARLEPVLHGPPTPVRFRFRSRTRPTGHLTVASRATRDGAVLALVGELDIAVADQVAECVDAALAQGLVHLVLDLRDLSFCDCAGLTALLRARRLALAQQGWVRLAQVPARIEHLLRIAGLGDVFVCYPGVGEAFSDHHGRSPGFARGRPH